MENAYRVVQEFLTLSLSPEYSTCTQQKKKHTHAQTHTHKHCVGNKHIHFSPSTINEIYIDGLIDSHIILH